MMKNSQKAILWLALPFLIIAFFLYREYNISLRERDNTPVSTGNVLCTQEYAPVCGTDNRTYSNACEATQINNVSVAYSGVCGSESPSPSPDVLPLPSVDTGSIDMTGSVTEDNSLTGVTDESAFTGSVWTGNLSWTGENLTEYFNEAYQYGFSIPRGAYYAGFGPQEGANHSVGIKMWNGVENFESADVQVFFYNDEILPELQNTDMGFYQEASTGKTFLKLEDNSVVILPMDRSHDNIVNTIIRTVYVRE